MPPYQNTNGIFHRTRTNNSKISLETQNIPNNENNLRKKNRAGGVMLPDFRLQSYSNQNSMVLTQKQKNWSVEQKREPRNKPTLIWLIMYNKGGKNIEWRKDSLFNKWCWENWTATCKRITQDYFLIP